MNNHVIFAAAGNGKTYGICQRAREYLLDANDNKYVLLLTYTNEGARSLESEYQKQNYGVIDCNIQIKTWYGFLLSELIKPYQRNLKLKTKSYSKEYDFFLPENYIKSIAFYDTTDKPKYYKASHIQYYINNAGDIYKDEASRLAYECIQQSDGKVIKRLENIYSCIFIDELQDYAGWDLELFKVLFDSSINITCVGDYKQATFRTNNSKKNKKFRDDRIKDFFVNLYNEGKCTISFDNKTRRFGHDICSYANTFFKDDKESLIVPNKTILDDKEGNAGVFLIDNKYLEQYCAYYEPIILRYNKDSKISFNHNCRVYNYGASKGATFDRTVIIPTKTVIQYIKTGKELAPQTKAKLYVACTRAKCSIAFAVDNPTDTNLFIPGEIIVGENKIPVYKYSPTN